MISALAKAVLRLLKSDLKYPHIVLLVNQKRNVVPAFCTECTLMSSYQHYFCWMWKAQRLNELSQIDSGLNLDGSNLVRSVCSAFSHHILSEQEQTCNSRYDGQLCGRDLGRCRPDLYSLTLFDTVICSFLSGCQRNGDSWVSYGLWELWHKAATCFDTCVTAGMSDLWPLKVSFKLLNWVKKPDV